MVQKYSLNEESFVIKVTKGKFFYICTMENLNQCILFSGMSEDVVSELAEFQISLRPGLCLTASSDHSTTG